MPHNEESQPDGVPTALPDLPSPHIAHPGSLERGHGSGYPPQQGWHYQPPHPNHEAYYGSRNAHSNNEGGPNPAVLHAYHANRDDKPSLREEQLEIEEPKVDPMKQDFHFYGSDQYPQILEGCKQKLADANLLTPENELLLTNTLLNATLIYNWETAPQSTRMNYLKMEEADRKRFMSEDEVASRHCATLTARKRSPKQSGTMTTDGVEKTRSFGLGEMVPGKVDVLVGGEEEDGKRKRDE